ncbi:hypothetical protein GPECTOR_61g852 [Gonium pectorale]|uniref:Calmodulin n=1 Tax=Gonium pectorale TaxID=33097 RepID=A0A150G4U0_GONPE|nr:hypothetical protein GPECTOR_61g852 [Gonium pectorale]|eukprot:KXZ44899.1 hypothetical protein GPECTOR_61g852 [Gonium pectorale]
MRQFFGHTALSVIWLLVLLIGRAHGTSETALNAFFKELDRDADGTVDALEVSSFIENSIGGAEFDTPAENADAAQSFLHAIDGADAGTTVSLDELDVHLHAVLSGVRVCDWVRHGLGLPQYAEAFRNHSITALDFPMLIESDGRVLAEELGVISSFHRQRLVRAIKLQILGLGTPPSEPQDVSCEAAAGSVAAVAVRWSPPSDLGRPPLHRYVLERAGAAGQWALVAEVDDAQPAAALLDVTATTTAVAARLLYRVAAWNLYGRSPYGMAEAQPIPVARRANADSFHRCSSEGDMGIAGGAGAGASAAAAAAPGAASARRWGEAPQLRGHGPRGHAQHHGGHQGHYHVGSAPALAAGAMAAAAPGSPASRHVSYAGCAGGGRYTPRHASLHSHTGSGELLYGGGGGAAWDVDGPGSDSAAELEAEAELPPAAAAAEGRSGRDRDKVCALPGCGRKLDLLHYRDYARRHYCGRCQQTVCGAHTAYSPHGATGSCGHESRCVCVVCFTHFNPAYQRFLRQRNTLKPAASGPGPGPSASAGTSAPASSATAGALADGTPLPRPGSGTQLQALEASGGKSASKLLWERAATKLFAITRFRTKGGKAGGTASSRGTPSMATVLE